ncbi:acetyl-CoA C-acetyltransferase [Pseudohaliea sp.]|uniref:acetyl-CoA C-acetyltransferase n=1 Tax=Pseudohaliea sp. TaxID=2740289 RepID=UPI0032EE2989
MDAYIVAATRTAGGRKGGRLAGFHPVDLSALLLDELLDRCGSPSIEVEDVIFGCVTQIGEQSANIARGAILASRLPLSVPGTTVDRQCGSSQQALHFAAQAIMSGCMDVVIAGGVESMSRVPLGSSVFLAKQEGFGGPLSPKILERFGEQGRFSQFTGAEQVARKYGLARPALDAFALESHQRAARATRRGAFNREIFPLKVTGEDGQEVSHEADEGIRFDANLEAISEVKLLADGGCLTAATSSQICDGAAAVMLASERAISRYELQPLARIRETGVLGGDPVIMLEAPIPATQATLRKAGLGIGDIDLYEVNEAFASIPLAWAQALGADRDRMNVNGGAISLGHPLGASGAKLMTTLVHALVEKDKHLGLLTMCEGGGMANVTIVERV